MARGALAIRIVIRLRQVAGQAELPVRYEPRDGRRKMAGITRTVRLDRPRVRRPDVGPSVT
jgi:hypothetical protein